MRICIKCKGYSARKICPNCMDKWVNMRKQVFDKLTDLHGKLCPSNHQIFIVEMKRLEKIWKTKPDQFYEELSKLTK